MMDFLQPVLILWVIGIAALVLCGLVTYMDARGPVPRRKGARMMFAAPLWPGLVVIIVIRNFRQAWRDADWKELKR